MGVSQPTISRWVRNYPLDSESALSKIREYISTGETSAACKEAARRKFLNTSFENLSLGGKRRRVFEEQNFTCVSCKLSTWLDRPISLELDHKSGDKTDNSRENLEGLCPNCHSFTSTWKGRNMKKKPIRISVSEECFMNHLENNPSIRQALIAAGMPTQGRDYKWANEVILNHKIKE